MSVLIYCHRPSITLGVEFYLEAIAEATSSPRTDKEFLFLFGIGSEAVAAKRFPNKGNLIVPKP
ncbi:hypothetical protein AUJ40_02245 [Candidatus Berkelbacteria bacterium CG1_02_42_45]|uniref:Uncharacterized protein n=3 Tax=Candidatus Berkelbacteria TaxID=1618330 RepID=A0A2M7K0Z6_9BACT|nr:MAG: hypothetical protein AUJ40_02245 [Candidatus Berkelbacteria bacterium CG1_02_42_45]PIR27447.1 MAG: hypothetical protein COV40_00730 [Candidatus Berkelbacteria bacterium CG11_big_fil_rev_8_21_14_0_20_42_15]PIX29909.1 MAG: hypothetical protein COZ63_02650 [Candidatus Berkelbacteria bacterium CG_4_8_14_3_um_filter_42_13]